MERGCQAGCRTAAIDWLHDRGASYPVRGEEIAEDSLSRIVGSLGLSFRRIHQGSYVTPDGTVRLTMEVAFPGPDGTLAFPFRSEQDAELRLAPRAYAAFVSGSPHQVFMVPFDELASWLAMLPQVVVSSDRSYWWIRVTPTGGRFLLQGHGSEHEIDLGPFLLGEHP